MSMTNKILRQELREANRKLGIVNNAVFKQIQIINSIQAERDRTEEHMRICEKEHERKDVIISYLETREHTLKNLEY